MTRLTVAELLGAAGCDLGVTGWRRVEQAEIDDFARLTGDDQWIHVDPVRAAAGPFGQTVAHGYLLLSLVPQLLGNLFELTDAALSINYGLDRVRFTAPVPAGAEVRLRAAIKEAEPRGGGVLARAGVTLELSGSERPALVCEALMLIYAAEDPHA